MISVLFLIPTLDRGGAENVLVDLVSHLNQEKFHITVQTLFDKDAQKERLPDGVEYKTFLYKQFRGNSRLLSVIPARTLYNRIVRKRYDVVVSYLEGPTAHIVSGCPYKDSKTVAWIHSALDNLKDFSVGFLSGKAAIEVYSSFDRVIFVAESVKDRIEETTGVPFENSSVLYNTVNAEEIKTKSMEKITEDSFKSDEIVIISTGKIAPVKGYDRLAHVHKKLRDSGIKAHVYLMGIGPDQPIIEEYLKENQLTDSFTFLGFQQNPYKYIARADLFVCSSRREGFSTAATEALIVGTPVCTVDVSGMKELLGEHNEFGVVTENSEEALYDGIKKLIEDPELLAYYREQAKKRGESFRTERTVKAVEEMLLSL